MRRSPATSCNGIPNTEMMPFKEQLTEPQIWQLVAYLKTQGANLKEKPTYVPDPDGQVIKTEKQTFKIEIVARGLETPWGLAFLPDGRLLITERPGRLRIVEKGQAAAGAVTGTPTVWERQDGGTVRRRGPPAVREERLDLSCVLGAGSEQHGASVGDRGGRGRLAARPWRSAVAEARAVARRQAAHLPQAAQRRLPCRTRRTRRTR